MGFVLIEETHININDFRHSRVRYVVCLHASHTLVKNSKAVTCMLLKIVVLNADCFNI